MVLEWSLAFQDHLYRPKKYGLKLKVVLKWSDVYIENRRVVLLIAGFKLWGIVKWRGLKSQGLLYMYTFVWTAKLMHVQCYSIQRTA